MSLSVCLIVRNEEEVIARVLDCAKKIADEIVIVDTGSTDKTVEIAEQYTQKIYFCEWNNNFSDVRNFAFNKAECDYLMWLDADDVITDDNCKKIKELVGNGGFDTAYLKYVAAFDGDNPTFIYYRERIFSRSTNPRFTGAVHETCSVKGKVVYSDAEIHHRKLKSGDPFRNLKIYQKLIASGEKLDERSQFYYARELFYCGMYRESAAVFEHYLTRNGWVENKIEACQNLYLVYSALGDTERAESSLLKSLLYAPPKSYTCCMLGERFLQKNELNSAIYWYEHALATNDDVRSGAFVNLDYSGFIPCIQLCVIYDKLGDFERANAYNEEAGRLKPQNQSYLSNKQYFERKFNEEVKTDDKS